MARIDFEKTLILRGPAPTPETAAPKISSDADFYEKTDPGISSSDSYQPPQRPTTLSEGVSAAEKTVEKKSWAPKFLEKRRAVKEAEGIIEKMMRLDGASDEAVRYFFKNDLPKLAAASRLHPEKIRERLHAALNTAAAHRTQSLADAPYTHNLAPWFSLAQLACGDLQAFVQALENVPQNPAVLFALESVSAFRPREASHLLRKFFEQADLKNRMAALRTAVVSENLGDGHLIGELFVKLMAATTAEERQKIVEPFLESLIQKSAGASTNPAVAKSAQGKLAWLGAYYHGWIQEK